jgi:sulfate adenylyltransferase (ADP) / ATP adenylyltransferase
VHAVVTSNIENVPFKHFVLRIPQPATTDHLIEQYLRLLQETKIALKAANQGTDYNVAFTSDWIVLIPRSRAVWGGPFGANALGMLGLVSVRDTEEKDRWRKLGYTDHLRNLGIPIDT